MKVDIVDVERCAIKCAERGLTEDLKALATPLIESKIGLSLGMAAAWMGVDPAVLVSVWAQGWEAGAEWGQEQALKAMMEME